MFDDAREPSFYEMDQWICEEQLVIFNDWFWTQGSIEGVFHFDFVGFN